MKFNKPIYYPYLHDQYIEDEANKMLLSHFACSINEITLPIPVDEIVELLGYTINYGLESQIEGDVLGAIDFNKNEMWLNSELGWKSNRGRENFTIAHELGHYALHKDVFEQEKYVQSLFPKEADRILCRTASKKERQEQQADIFASYLLMPLPLIQREYINILNTKHKYIAFNETKVTRELSSIFGTSEQAMSIRLDKIGLFKGNQYNRLQFT